MIIIDIFSTILNMHIKKTLSTIRYIIFSKNDDSLDPCKQFFKLMPQNNSWLLLCMNIQSTQVPQLDYN